MKQTDLDSHKQKIAETADRIRAIKADARVASLKAASLTLEYAVSYAHSFVQHLLIFFAESCHTDESIS
jgi:ABC-type Fe3+-citrate transport system substrate-binding protein